MHRWMRQRKQWPQVKAPPMERAPDSVRCGKWDLRATQNRRNRAISAQDLSVTEKQLTTCTKKRKRHASPSSSANSVVGENNIQALKMERTQIVFDKWNYATTQIFIEVMLEEAKKEESTNSKKTRTFNPHQWVAICSEFGTRTNTMGYSVQKLKEKFTRLKHDLSVFKDLKDRSGFGWDPVRQTVTAPEPVWQEYLQGHKDAKQFKSKGLDHYDLLVELCEGTLATGAFSGYPSTLGGPTAEGEREMMRQGKSIRMALDEIASCFDEEQYYKAYEKLAFGPPTGRQGFMGLSIDRRIVTAAVCNRKQVSAVVSTAVRAVVLKPRTTGLISMIIIILSRHFNAVVEVDYVEASGKQDVTPIPTDSTHRKGGRRGRRL
ncbi:hypothetical protein RHMOL_Rhmol02G0012300 [Rhododendron molle]|uniref:Uncharacterized protein n=1 Tax=Rhododendron molle TaxID=49168 RepID=A0ACC0PM41_RHOML|nr:hypothetical protein RHMOL_Rhmol02G0012300 [Rhododendron molle]